jgi:hypothetical protein
MAVAPAGLPRSRRRIGVQPPLHPFPRTPNSQKIQGNANKKKLMIKANQPLIIGFFPGTRAELLERHGNNTHNWRPPRRPPEGE